MSDRRPPTSHRQAIVVGTCLGAMAILGLIGTLSRSTTSGASPTFDLESIARTLPSQMNPEQLDETETALRSSLDSAGPSKDLVRKLLARIEGEKAFRERAEFRNQVDAALAAGKVDDAVAMLNRRLKDLKAVDREHLKSMLEEIDAARSDDVIQRWLQSLPGDHFEGVRTEAAAGIRGLTREFATPGIADYFVKQVERNTDRASELRKKFGKAADPSLTGRFSFSPSPQMVARPAAVPAVSGYSAPVGDRLYRDSVGGIVSERETEARLRELRRLIQGNTDPNRRAYLEGVLQALEVEWARIQRTGPIESVAQPRLAQTDPLGYDAAIQKLSKQYGISEAKLRSMSDAEFKVIATKSVADSEGISPSAVAAMSPSQRMDIQVRQLARQYGISESDARRAFDVIGRLDQGQSLSSSDQAFLRDLEQKTRR